MNATKVFSGKDHLVDDTNKGLFESDNFTIQCWVKTTKSGPLFVQDAANFSLLVAPNGAIQLTARIADNVQTIQSDKIGMNDNDWHHISAIKSGNHLSLLLNGKPMPVKETWAKLPKKAKKDKGLLIGTYKDSTKKSDHFIGELSQIHIWDFAMTEEQAYASFLSPAKGTESGLVSHYPFKPLRSRGANNILVDVVVTFSIYNNTGLDLHKKDLKDNEWNEKFPALIKANEEVTITLKSSLWNVIHCNVTYENTKGNIDIKVLKSSNVRSSTIAATDGKDLMSEIAINANSRRELKAHLLIIESIVVSNMRNLYSFLNALRGKINRDQIETESGNLIDLVRYNKARQNFNLRIQLKPLAIVSCASTEEVQLVYKEAIANNLPIRVRSGGHDHEGECSGNDVVLIDMSRINHVKLVEKEGKTYAHIGPGNRFKTLTTTLAKQEVMIPHGTCATVGIAGFTFGGGWGPWTRREGMCCERLVGATIVLGDGSVKRLDAIGKEKIPELLWALRGGGGMSYGIVTELVIETFALPEELIKFELEWNPFGSKEATIPTIKVLKAWERVIQSKETSNLSGTNIKITGKHWPFPNYDNFDENTEVHNCLMYGYWVGNEASLKEFIKANLGEGDPKLTIDGYGGTVQNQKENYGSYLMSSWDRESFYNVQRIANGLQGKPYPPDLDTPAPHKISSRLANGGGLQEGGYRGLLMSLTSNLIDEGNRQLGLFTYITLGAIVGDFYQNRTAAEKKQSAFPYKDSLYTIQYQTWWNSHLKEQEEGQDSAVYEHTNRALDWMQTCRDFDIPNTSGSFISFKDSSIPTTTYFGDSYEELKRIKQQYSKDPKNHFRSRKTII